MDETNKTADKNRTLVCNYVFIKCCAHISPGTINLKSAAAGTREKKHKTKGNERWGIWKCVFGLCVRS